MLRVLIADDSLGFGTLAAAWLEQASDLEVVGTARSASDAIAALDAGRPDVLILDRLLPQPQHSAHVIAHARSRLPGTAILLVSGMPAGDLATQARNAGADGHVSKATTAGDLVDAVRRVAVGRRRRHPG